MSMKHGHQQTPIAMSDEPCFFPIDFIGSSPVRLRLLSQAFRIWS
jgi:hypothetical protein